MNTAIVGFLLVYCLVRELFFLASTQKLVNKLMSRNYYDFVVSQSAGTLDSQTKTDFKIPAVDESDDLNTLNSLL